MSGSLKEPPYNVEAEQSVLGGLMIDNTAWDRVADIVSENDFFTRDHRMIFRAIAQKLESSKPADPVSISEFLQNYQELAEVGGIEYLVQLNQNTPSAANIRHYAEIVRERSLRRSLIAAADEIVCKGFAPNGMDARALLDFAQAKVMAISESASKGQSGPQHVAPVMDSVLQHIDELHSRPGGSDITGLETGFAELDKLTTGLQPGDLVIIAARPAMGKTALALNICEHVAINKGQRVGFFSLEMANNQLGVRLLSGVSRLHQQRVKIGRLNEAEFKKLYSAASRLRDTQIYLDEEGSLTVNDLRTRARRLHRECGGLHLLVIDYLQLMQGSSHGDNRANEIAEISRGLKMLAKELQIPIIALSQLNRSLESRPNKRPVMSDLRDSGGIEQDADLILFIYRDDYYNEDSLDKGIAELVIGKQRNGPTGTVRLTFIGELTRFENMAHGSSIPSLIERENKRAKRAGNSRSKNDDSGGYADM
ncbi:MAG: replicative DNA helicase [Sulfuriferula sp.]